VLPLLPLVFSPADQNTVAVVAGPYAAVTWFTGVVTAVPIACPVKTSASVLVVSRSPTIATPLVRTSCTWSPVVGVLTTAIGPSHVRAFVDDAMTRPAVTVNAV
jgi:hypothetical protein